MYYFKEFDSKNLTAKIPHYKNEKTGQIIQYDKFYIHEVQELIDIRNDYINWVQQQAYGMVCFLLHFISFLLSFFLIQKRQDFFCLFFVFFRAKPVAYRSSQARDRIRAAAGLCHNHSNATSEPHL